MERKAHIRDLDFKDLPSGKGIRFTIAIPAPESASEFVYIEGCLAGKNAKGEIWLTMPRFSSRASSAIKIPLSMEIKLKDLILQNYSAKLTYRRRKRASRKKAERYAVPTAQTDTPPWDE